MKRFLTFSSTLFFLVPAGAFAQVEGPVFGYVPEGSSIRTVHGMAAAGIVSGAIDIGRDLALMEIAPDQSSALATAADSGEALLVVPGPAGFRVTGLSGVAAGASRIVYSPSGKSAAFWFSATGHLQVVKGLPAAPSVRDTDASFLGGDPGALAVSDDGAWVIGAWAGQVYALGPDSAVKALTVNGTAQALCFFHNSLNAGVITANEVVIITDVSGGATPKTIWSKPEGVEQEGGAQTAVGLAASFDNSRLTVAGSSGGLFTFDMATGQGAGADCGCAPTALAGMGGSMFRLTSTQAGALKVFDAATNEVWIVPLAVAADGGQQ